MRSEKPRGETGKTSEGAASQRQSIVERVRAAVRLRELEKLSRGQRTAILAIGVAAFVLRVIFALYTHRTWEDALIAVLHSENFARGLGLTHSDPGMPPVQGFTGPLNVLIPLVPDLIHVGWGLIFIKILSAFIAIPTVLLAAAVALNDRFRVNIWLVYLLCGYVAFEHQQILWGMAGMETQVAVFALFLTLYCALNASARAVGVCLALCMYTRPDFLFFVAIVTLYRTLGSWKELKTIGTVAAALYAPWLIFASLYYGSPVPNTIVAKEVAYGVWTTRVSFFSQAFWETVWARVWDYLYLPLGPSFAGHGSGFLKMADDGAISHICLLVILLGAIALLRNFDRFYIIPLGFFAIYSFYYIFLVQAIAGWYLVPFSAVNCLVLVLGLAALWRSFVLPSRIELLSRITCCVYLAPFLLIIPITFKGEHDIQAYVEVPVRMAMGQYLFEHKKPGQKVAAEPLGYLGYYSQMPVYDWPGLASAEVVGFLREHPKFRTFDRMIERFQPDWIALREHEYKYMISLDHMSFLKDDYSIERVFKSDPEHTRDIYRIEHNIDIAFYLLKRAPRIESVSVMPSSGEGLKQAFTVRYEDANGYQDIKEALLLVQVNMNGASACWVKYAPGERGYYLRDDGGAVWMGPISQAGSGVLKNHQCTVSAAESSALGEGSGLKVSFGLTFEAAFAGKKNLYPVAFGSRRQSHWMVMGTWIVPATTQHKVSGE